MRWETSMHCSDVSKKALDTYVNTVMHTFLPNRAGNDMQNRVKIKGKQSIQCHVMERR